MGAMISPGLGQSLARLVPRSLLWRTVLLIVVLLVVSALAWQQILTRSERAPRTRQLAETVAIAVNLTRTALVASDASKRTLLLRELSEREGIRVYPAEPDDDVTPLPDDAQNDLLQEDIKRLLGPQTRIGAELFHVPGFWVSFRLAEDDDYWVMLPAERLEFASARQWMGWGALALALAFLGGWAVVSRLTRPLKALAEAARQVGRGRYPQPLAEQGPSEAQVVAAAFNQMTSDLARLDQERALVLAGISHDLRTPLARLRLAAEMGVEEPALREGMVADIEDMDTVIGQFMAFARDGDDGPTQPVSPDDLVRQTASHFARLGTVLDLDARCGEVLIPVRVEALRRALMNLINNAIRHGQPTEAQPADARPITLSTWVEGGRVILEVSDRGPGIPATDAERMKQPFTRLNTARTNAGGSGLGLAIVDRVARSHGGRLDLLERPGGGLLARITLPLSSPPTQPASAQAPTAS